MKKRVGKILFWLCIVVCVLGLAYIAIYYFRKDKNEDVYQKVQKQVEEKKQEEDAEDEIPIDFASLKETNPDIYAWIEIPDTNVNYPIVQSADDDSYYLNHTIDGQEGYPGSIYTEKVNAKDFSDFNTVIYGHDMKDGSMFKDLHKFEDADFFEQHDKVTIYTENECKTYQIFAAVVYDNRHLMYSFDNNNISARKAFLESLSESRSLKNQFRSGVEVDENSHIITLSTCIGGQPDKRFLVEAVEIDE